MAGAVDCADGVNYNAPPTAATMQDIMMLAATFQQHMGGMAAAPTAVTGHLEI